MIPKEVAEMRDAMMAVGVHERTATDLAWRFYEAMKREDD